MSLHRRLKAHHHVSIWSISVLTLIMSNITYTNAVITSAQDSGPSARTRSFMGGGSQQSVDRSNLPAECQVGQQGSGTDGRELIAQHDEAMRQKQALEQQMLTAPDEQKGQISAQLQAANQLEASLKTQIETSMGAGGPEGGPSDACKAAIVAREKENIRKAKDNLGAALSKIEGALAAVNKVESTINTLESAGVSADKIAKLRSDVESVKTNATTVKEFLTGMQSAMSTFISSSDGTPAQAYDNMKTANSSMQSRGSKASTAADALVAAFEDIESIINGIKEANGSN